MYQGCVVCKNKNYNHYIINNGTLDTDLWDSGLRAI